MIRHVNRFKESKYVLFFIKNDYLLKNTAKSGDKISNNMRKGFDNKSVYNEKYLTTKVVSYGGRTNTDFNGKQEYIEWTDEL